jgi:hypothetical protein
MRLVTRRLVIGGVPVLLFGGICCAAHAQASDSGPGCWTPDDKVDDLFRKAGVASSFSNNYSNLEPRSGNVQLDRALAQGLATIAGTFGVVPGFAYYQEDAGVNAQATAEVLLQRTDGTVMFGLSLLQLLLQRSYPDAGILAVCAHEFGHIVSFKNGMIADLSPDRRQPYRAEQFADYMAGFFAGSRKLLFPNYPAVVFATTQDSFGGGDHGSGQQRAEAVQEGFLAAYEKKQTPKQGIQ